MDCHAAGIWHFDGHGMCHPRFVRISRAAVRWSSGAPSGAMETENANGGPGLQLGTKPEDIHVLLVDDERLSRVVVGNLLRKCNYQVTVASSGLEALDVLRKHAQGTFHLILTDVMMPDVDGIELLKHIRSDEAFNSMPVVMMSANEHTDTVFECIQRGAEDYLLKPVTKKEVQYICQHVWRRQREGNGANMGTEEHEDNLQHGFGEPISGSQAAGEDSQQRDEEREAGIPAPGLPSDSAREAAARLLSDRVQSGRFASSSGQHGSRGSGQQGGQHQQSIGLAVGQPQGLPLSLYFAQRKLLVNSTESFRIFCAALALLQSEHAKGETVKVRPSRLRFAADGTLEAGPCSQRQAEIEDKLYASPEELLNKPLNAASDIYSLGILFFELFNPVMSASERMHVLSGLRHRILPLSLLRKRPQEAAFMTSLLHPDPSSRPTAAKLMQPKTLEALQRSIYSSVERSGQGSKDTVDVKVLLDFLRAMHGNKEAEASHVKNHISMLDRDIRQVSQKLKDLLAEDAHRRSSDKSGDLGRQSSAEIRESGHKRKQGNPSPSQHSNPHFRASFDTSLSEGQESEEHAKWTKIWNDNPVLENLYMKRREAKLAMEKLVQAAPEGECAEECRTAEEMTHLADMSQDLLKLANRPTFKVKATLKYGDLMGEGDMVCSAAFDRDDEFFATAGVSKRIKVFELASILNKDSMLHYPVLEMSVNSKISSLCWNSYVKSCLLAADYEGAIQLWDVSANAVTAQFEEHTKRVWSADFSRTDPTKFVSGGDDGTVRLWSMRDYAATAVIDTKANVCSVQMSPNNANLLAFGSANYRVYLYDLRKMEAPLAVIGGHKKAVSYVRFLGGDQLVSASTDNKLKLWDINQATTSQGKCEPLMTYSGHTNQRNFVGLSVNARGYIACGSESNEVYAYYHSLPLPLASHPFALEPGSMDAELEGRQFVSTVCWSNRGSDLLAANSAGVIKVLHLDY